MFFFCLHFYLFVLRFLVIFAPINNNKEIELTKREFSLLQILMENKNIVLTRDVLMEKLCGYDYLGETNVIDVYVRYLRTKIDDAFNVKIISTIRGVGYVIKDE